SDIVDPPSRGGFRGAEEAVLEGGGEGAQGLRRRVDLRRQRGRRVLTGRRARQRTQQLVGLPGGEAGAQRRHRCAQLGGGRGLGQPVQGLAEPVQLEGERARQRGVAEQQLDQQLRLHGGVEGAAVGGAGLGDQRDRV